MDAVTNPFLYIINKRLQYIAKGLYLMEIGLNPYEEW